jgi:hypothetical protein
MSARPQQGCNVATLEWSVPGVCSTCAFLSIGTVSNTVLHCSLTPAIPSLNRIYPLLKSKYAS